MKKNGHITAFYLETLLLILVFVSIILAMTHVFGLGKLQSSRARLLTNAVCLAENAAEAVSASDSAEALASLLDEGGNARLLADGGVELAYRTDMRPDASGGAGLRLQISWEPSEEDPDFVHSTIRVYHGSEPEAIYTLKTAVLLKGDAA